MARLSILLFGLSLLVLPFSSHAEDVLPQSIGPLRLEQFQSGEEARREIDQLHGKRINFRAGYIGTYGGADGKAKLWVSDYDSENEAIEAIGRMAQRLQTSEERGFWHFREIAIEGLPVFFVVGMGQAHYFFQKGVRLIWLAVDPSLAKVAIRDLITKVN
ncbi:MAG: hypothetical protein GTO12_19355 [Proteobacteria bacterium]|nr:hypothetical protein [Pseudomonadota bacterium]